MDFPQISPIIFSVGPLAIRWYSMAYLAGILIGWFIVSKYVKKYDIGFNKTDLEDLAFYVTLGVILGGRFGYVLFYGGEENPFLRNPLQVFEVWKGGMSFHGGIFGVITAIFIYAKRRGFSFFKVSDLVSLVVPIGIFFGRLANFINDELWGRVTNVSWAVKFPNGGYLPRHPSQVYEALLEGLVMFVVLNFLWRYKFVRERCGIISALFVLLYAVFRSFIEQFREPDAQLGFIFANVTMGQLLSFPLILVGLVVIFQKLKPVK
ncbi:MAG: prolipoprotein diacylglyceryl transferase [Alphaproteobacteria bacterium]|nr:prolipoprotein diacylglyceryl transferase [Alphaproteobacteria bacterium]